jgi:hypothetical protein
MEAEYIAEGEHAPELQASVWNLLVQLRIMAVEHVSGWRKSGVILNDAARGLVCTGLPLAHLLDCIHEMERLDSAAVSTAPALVKRGGHLASRMIPTIVSAADMLHNWKLIIAWIREHGEFSKFSKIDEDTKALLVANDRLVATDLLNNVAIHSSRPPSAPVAAKILGETTNVRGFLQINEKLDRTDGDNTLLLELLFASFSSATDGTLTSTEFHSCICDLFSTGEDPPVPVSVEATDELYYVLVRPDSSTGLSYQQLATGLGACASPSPKKKASTAEPSDNAVSVVIEDPPAIMHGLGQVVLLTTGQWIGSLPDACNRIRASAAPADDAARYLLEQLSLSAAAIAKGLAEQPDTARWCYGMLASVVAEAAERHPTRSTAGQVAVAIEAAEIFEALVAAEAARPVPAGGSTGGWSWLAEGGDSGAQLAKESHHSSGIGVVAAAAVKWDARGAGADGSRIVTALTSALGWLGAEVSGQARVPSRTRRRQRTHLRPEGIDCAWSRVIDLIVRVRELPLGLRLQFLRLLSAGNTSNTRRTQLAVAALIEMCVAVLTEKGVAHTREQLTAARLLGSERLQSHLSKVSEQLRTATALRTAAVAAIGSVGSPDGTIRRRLAVVASEVFFGLIDKCFSSSKAAAVSDSVDALPPATSDADDASAYRAGLLAQLSHLVRGASRPDGAAGGSELVRRFVMDNITQLLARHRRRLRASTIDALVAPVLMAIRSGYSSVDFDVFIQLSRTPKLSATLALEAAHWLVPVCLYDALHGRLASIPLVALLSHPVLSTSASSMLVVQFVRGACWWLLRRTSIVIRQHITHALRHCWQRYRGLQRLLCGRPAQPA